MKKAFLFLALIAGLQACSDDPEPSPNKNNTTSASLVGKWDSKKTDSKELNAAGQQTATNTQVYDPGVQMEFLSNGKWHQYDQYQISDNGRYIKQGNKLTITTHLNGTVSDSATFVMHIVSLTEKEMITRDTIYRADNTRTARETLHTR